MRCSCDFSIVALRLGEWQRTDEGQALFHSTRERGLGASAGTPRA